MSRNATDDSWCWRRHVYVNSRVTESITTATDPSTSREGSDGACSRIGYIFGINLNGWVDHGILPFVPDAVDELHSCMTRKEPIKAGKILLLVVPHS